MPGPTPDEGVGVVVVPVVVVVVVPVVVVVGVVEVCPLPWPREAASARSERASRKKCSRCHAQRGTRVGACSGRKWEARTPAMAAGLTDHRWSVGELLHHRVRPTPLNLDTWRRKRCRRAATQAPVPPPGALTRSTV